MAGKKGDLYITRDKDRVRIKGYVDDGRPFQFSFSLEMALQARDTLTEVTETIIKARELGLL